MFEFSTSTLTKKKVILKVMLQNKKKIKIRHTYMRYILLLGILLVEIIERKKRIYTKTYTSCNILKYQKINYIYIS